MIQAGPENGPLVVLLHGFPEFWYGWRHQIGALVEAGFKIWIPDQRGYNLSYKPKGVPAYRVDELASDVIGLIDRAGQEKCLLAGHDWGAAVAWETAMRHPERIEKLVILNVPQPDVMTRYLLSSPEQLRRSWYIYYFQIPGLPEWSLRLNGYSGLRRALLASGKPGTFTEAEIEQYIQAWKQPGALNGMLNWYRAAFRAGLRGPKNLNQVIQRRVQVPTLMCWGKQDVALSWRMAKDSIDLCNQGRLVIFEHATHWVQHDEAQAVTREIAEFFTPV